MLLGIVLFASISIMIAMFILRKPILAAAAMGAWLLTSVQSYTLSDYPVTFDTYVGLTLFSFAMVVVCVISAIGFTTDTKREEENNDDWSDVRNELEEVKKEQDSMAFLYKNRRKRSRL